MPTPASSPSAKLPPGAAVAARPDSRASVGADAYRTDGTYCKGQGGGHLRHAARRRLGGTLASRSLSATRAQSTRRPPQRPRRRRQLLLAVFLFFVEICKVLGGLAATEPLPPARTEQVRRELIGDRSLTTMC